MKMTVTWTAFFFFFKEGCAHQFKLFISSTCYQKETSFPQTRRHFQEFL